MLVQRAMNLVYASIGTAVEATGPGGAHGLWMPIAAAAASYYSTIGANATSSKAFEVLQSPSSGFIKRAWGMISLPFVKRLSLEVSKFLKGAAIADRIIISGVPCFIICRHPYPVLSTALKRFHRQAEREVTNLPEILEDDEPRHIGYTKRSQSYGDDYPSKDIIFHLTGGGFFTHTLAGDLPFLIDWSTATNSSVVICPEYDLLPEHIFPVAINQVTDVYCALSSGDAASILGFRPNRIIVTGESTGGNLAASLCAKLCIEGIVNKAKKQHNNVLFSAADDLPHMPEMASSGLLDDAALIFLTQDNKNHVEKTHVVRIPDGLMLCCPVLNLCESISPSRMISTEDPILPPSFIMAISEAYVSNSGTPKNHPLVSPYFTPDDLIELFPPSLIYTSNLDPLLDDAVHFNARLRQMGVDSSLRAAQDLPHAFWGLAHAGFPEAEIAQKECMSWLVKLLNNTRKPNFLLSH